MKKKKNPNMRTVLNQKENMKKNMRKTLNQKENMRKTNMRKIMNQNKKVAKRCIKKNKKYLNKVEMFCQQIRQFPFFIFTLCYPCFYKRSIRLLKSIIYLM